MKTSHDELTRIVRTFRPGAVVGPLEPLKGGISSGIAAFNATANGTTERLILREPGEWALKRLENATEIEFKLLAELKRQYYPTSTPYYVAPPDGETPLLIVEYLPGKILFTPSDMAHFVSQIANALSRIHALAVDDFSFMPQMSLEVSSRIGGAPVRQKPIEDEKRIRSILRAHWPFEQMNPSALLHGDFWPGNLLWNGQTLSAPIDWEDSGIGDPLLDIAISRQELAFAFDVEIAHAFTDAYRRLTDLNWTNLPLWDLYASLRPIDQFSIWAGGWADLGRPEITAETMRASRADLVARALEKLGA